MTDSTSPPDSASDQPSEPRTGMPLWLYGTLVAVVVVGIGLGVMAGLVWISDPGETVPCEGPIELGYAPDITEQAAAEPDPQFIDRRCRWWYAIDPNGRLVAYKNSVTGLDCQVGWDYDDDLWRCDGDVIDEALLEEWPSSIEDIDNRRSIFIVDFGPAA